MLYRQRQDFNGSIVLQLVLPKRYQSETLNSVHDQMGHMGRERTLDLLIERFYWTNISKDVAEYISRCDRCLRRKSLTNQKAPLVNITTSYPMELVSIDYLTLETSKGGFENILVVMDHFTRYAQAYPTRNQTAKTTARVLFDNFVCHYGFPARIHSDQGRNFMNKFAPLPIIQWEMDRSNASTGHYWACLVRWSLSRKWIGKPMFHLWYTHIIVQNMNQQSIRHSS